MGQFDTFKREFLNIPLTTTIEQRLPLHAYKACEKPFPESLVAANEWVMAIHTDFYENEISIAIAGGPYVRVAYPMDSTQQGRARQYVDKSIFVSKVRELIEMFRIKTIVARAGSELPRMLQEGKVRANFVRLRNEDYGLACTRFRDDVLSGEAYIYQSKELEESVKNAGAHKSYSGGWWWKPIMSDVTISPLVAASMAYDAAQIQANKRRPRKRILGGL